MRPAQTCRPTEEPPAPARCGPPQAMAGAFVTCEGARQRFPTFDPATLMNATPNPSPARLRLLLVDADHEFFALMMFLLDEIVPRRFVLDWASTHAFAVSLLRRQRFDLCFINTRIGHRSGLDLLLDMRAQGCTTPVILLSTGEELPEPRGGRIMDQLDRSRISAEVLRQAFRDAGFRPASLPPLAPALPTAPALPDALALPILHA